MKMIKLILVGLFLSFTFQGVSQKFENSYSLPGQEKGNDVAELSDGSLITVGASSSFGAGGNDVFVLKTNKSGKLLWIKYFGGSANDDANGVAIGPNDEIYVAGYFTMGTNKDGYLIKLDKNGNVIWSKTYGGAASDEIKDVAVYQTKLYMLGTTSSAGAGALDMWFLKTDIDGNVIKDKTFGYASDDIVNAFTISADGNIVAAGRTSSFTRYNVMLVKFNLLGDTIWTRKYNYYLNGGNSTVPFANGITSLTDQNLLVCGTG